MRVLLVHGLGRTWLSLARLGRALRRAGHQPEYFAYYAFATPYETIRERLASRLRALAERREPVALIGHSLGGLLLRHAVVEAPRLRVHRLIMLGTPNQPPRRAQRAARWRWFRMLARSSGELLASPEAYRRIPPPAVPYTVVAGTGGLRLLGRPFGAERHDGIVAVDETRVRGADDLLLFPVGHTFMMNDRRVRQALLGLLGPDEAIGQPAREDR